MNEQIISKVAEWLSIANTLGINAPQEDYHKANKLAFELQMILPNEDIEILISAITKTIVPCECIAYFRNKYGHQEPLNKNRFFAHQRDSFLRQIRLNYGNSLLCRTPFVPEQLLFVKPRPLVEGRPYKPFGKLGVSLIRVV
jgi:hypothetical protein